jgi:NTP pyrophosphatase (non-canonical NTP hydrolase)
MHLEDLTLSLEGISARYAERFGFRRDADWFALKLAEEVGELIQAHLKLAGQARVAPEDASRCRERLEDELADVLGQALLLAHHHKIDVPAAIRRKWLRWLPGATPDADP